MKLEPNLIKKDEKLTYSVIVENNDFVDSSGQDNLNSKGKQLFINDVTATSEMGQGFFNYSAKVLMLNTKSGRRGGQQMFLIAYLLTIPFEKKCLRTRNFISTRRKFIVYRWKLFNVITDNFFCHFGVSRNFLHNIRTLLSMSSQKLIFSRQIWEVKRGFHYLQIRHTIEEVNYLSDEPANDVTRRTNLD